MWFVVLWRLEVERSSAAGAPHDRRRHGTFATRTVPIYLVHFRHYCQPCACMVCGWANPPCYGDDNHLSYTILTRQHGTLATD